MAINLNRLYSNSACFSHNLFSAGLSKASGYGYGRRCRCRPALASLTSLKFVLYEFWGGGPRAFFRLVVVGFLAFFRA